MPTVAVAGNPDRSGVISEPVVVMVAEAELFAPLTSLVAPVVAVAVTAPVAVGVPATVHVMTPPAAKLATGEVGEHVDVKPAGNPLMAHVALVAAIAGAAAFVQVYVPLYATPMLAVAGKPLVVTVMSAPTLVNVQATTAPATTFAPGIVNVEPASVPKLAGLPVTARFESVHAALAIAYPAGAVSAIVTAVPIVLANMAADETAVPCAVVVTLVLALPKLVLANVNVPTPPFDILEIANAGGVTKTWTLCTEMSVLQPATACPKLSTILPLAATDAGRFMTHG